MDQPAVESRLGAWGRKVGNASVILGAGASAWLSAYGIGVIAGKIDTSGLSALDTIIPCILAGWTASGFGLIAVILRRFGAEDFQWRGVVGIAVGALPMVLPQFMP